MIYNKLVRDKIPDIMKDAGKSPSYIEMTGNYEVLYATSLVNKLKEEVNEYIYSGNVEELVDIQEVLYALINYHDLDLEEFDDLVQQKRIENGGYVRKIYLKEVIDNG